MKRPLTNAERQAAFRARRSQRSEEIFQALVLATQWFDTLLTDQHFNTNALRDLERIKLLIEEISND